jgi:hypothetical protein
VEELAARGGEVPLSLLLELRPSLRFVAGGVSQIAKLLAADARMEVVEVVSAAAKAPPPGDAPRSDASIDATTGKPRCDASASRGAFVPDNYRLRVRLRDAAEPLGGTGVVAPRAPPFNARGARSVAQSQRLQSRRQLVVLRRDLNQPPPPPASGAGSRDGGSGEAAAQAAAVASRHHAGQPLAQLYGCVWCMAHTTHPAPCFSRMRPTRVPLYL